MKTKDECTCVLTYEKALEGFFKYCKNKNIKHHGCVILVDGKATRSVKFYKNNKSAYFLLDALLGNSEPFIGPTAHLLLIKYQISHL